MLAKKPRPGGDGAGGDDSESGNLVGGSGGGAGALGNLLLTGHEAAVLSAHFHARGTHLASASDDGTVLIWSLDLLSSNGAAGGDDGGVRNTLVLERGGGAVNCVRWGGSDGSRVAGAQPASVAVAVWDAFSGRRLRAFRGSAAQRRAAAAAVASRPGVPGGSGGGGSSRLQGAAIRQVQCHVAAINAVAFSGCGQLLGSVADDGLLLIRDLRLPAAAVVSVLSCPLGLPLLALALAPASGDEAGVAEVYAAGIGEAVLRWDMRRPDRPDWQLAGHTDAITGLALSPDGASLLSNSMDDTLRIWDLSFGAEKEDRFVKAFRGHQHGMERHVLRCAWSASGEQVSCGSSDRLVHIWDVPSGEELYELPGHYGTVCEVAFHPSEPIVASCSTDGRIYLGSLQA